ncbi:MAG: ARC6/PARC6 family protein, partial [Cyanobacteria bacterium P01_F01_bin.42]
HPVPLDHNAQVVQRRVRPEDRLQQLPKQQYSAAAIAARKKLLQESHGILLNPKRRQEHDGYLFPELELIEEDTVASAHQPEEPEKGVDVDAEHLAGALILLLEFGEFDAVVELGLAHLNRPIDLEKMPSEQGPNDDDVALAVSIAHLELGREHWQREDCEAAGQLLKIGLKILKDEGKFLDIQAEIEADLSKLRPYRVLDLLALDLDDPLRDEGLSLLQDMLDARGGMEGNGDDHSGLSVNDFLLFIQQLRDQLTVDEQFHLFKAESMRPSSVANYLGVYAHVAKGVSEYSPKFISQAQSSLSSLADRQDLNLEQGMCSLLLGQPDAAVHNTQQSSDDEALAFISEYSEGAPDLIPGLYLYTQQWIQQEVFPYFRDLRDQSVSLEDYFNDTDVQQQLSDLEPDLPQVDSSSWSEAQTDAQWQQWLAETAHKIDDESPEPLASIDSAEAPQSTDWFSSLASSPTEDSVAVEDIDFQWNTPAPEAAAMLEERLATNSRVPVTTPESEKPQRPDKSEAGRHSPTKSVGQKKRRSHGSSIPPKKKPWVVWAAALLLGGSVVWGAVAVGRLVRPGSNEPAPATPSTSEEASPSPSSDDSKNEATSADPASNSGSIATDGLTEGAAAEILQNWQTVKADALGESRQIEQLDQILVEPALSRWKYSANIDRDEGKYTTYQLKNLQIDELKPESSDEALVRATIEEVRNQHFEGQAEPVASLEDSYQVDYRLVNQAGQWRIQEMEVIE